MKSPKPNNHFFRERLLLASVLLLCGFSVQAEPRTHFIHHDGMGSIVNTSDSNGNISSRTQFDAWGNKRYESNSTWNRFGFTGHEHDQESDLIYAKARYLDPDTGRFLSQDNWEGDVTIAPSLHRYIYVYQNPTVYVDPDGNVVWLPVLGYLAYTATNSAADTATDLAINESVSQITGEKTDTSLASVAKSFGENFAINTVTGGIGGKVKKVQTITKAVDDVRDARKAKASVPTSKADALSNDALAKNISNKTESSASVKHLEESPSKVGGDLKDVGVQKDTKFYRYVGEDEAQAIRNSGKIPNIDRSGNQKDVFFTDRLYKTGGRAKTHNQLPSKPSYRVEIDPADVSNRTPLTKVNPNDNPQWGIGGGVEARTKDFIPVDPSTLVRLKGVK